MFLPSEPTNPFEGCLNVEAEQALLGAMMSNPKLFTELSLKACYFSEPLHQSIYEAASEAVYDGQTLSPILLGDKLKCKPYVVKLVTAAMHVLNPQDYADEIMSLYSAREMIRACMLASDALKEGANPADIAAELSAKINATVEQRAWLVIRDNFEVSEAILEDMKKEHRPISSGYQRIDHAMGGGIHPGFSYGFAARKKVGKTVLASSISYNLNQRGIKHLFIACEMGSKQIHQRNLARGSGVHPSVFRDHSRWQKDTLTDISNFTVKDNRCIYYMDAPGLTFDGLKQAVNVGLSKYGVSGFILDYWQLVGGKKKGQSTSEHLDEVAQWIADFCRKHGLWSIVMAQINQEGNTRGGEGLRLAFDQVYQLHREDVSQPAAWLEMLDTRYTAWMNVGSPERGGLSMAAECPYFIEIPA